MRKRAKILKDISVLEDRFDKNAKLIRNNPQSSLVKDNEQIAAQLIILRVELETNSQD